MEKTQVCFRCEYFERFYIKGDTHYIKLKCGECQNHVKGEIVDSTFTCERFTKARSRNRQVVQNTKVALLEILRRISAVQTRIEAEDQKTKIIWRGEDED